jgi:acyl-CoA synthetase (AMP-forming)/AMP-acid ligase II
VFSFKQFEQSVDAIASNLYRLLPRGARAALFIANCAEYFLIQSALERAGLVRVPINSRLSEVEVNRIMDDCGVAAVFYDSSTAATARETARRTSALAIYVGDDTVVPDPLGHTLRFGELLIKDHSHHCDVGMIQPEDLCSINYTSGSSGIPKGVMLTHRNWLAITRNMLVDRDLRADVVAHVGPLTHASGTYFAPWFLRGATAVVVDGGVEGLLEAIPRHRVSAFTCVPTVLTRIVNHPDTEHLDLSSLRFIGYGAEPIPRNTLEKALAIFGPILTQNYGLTEAMMTCAYLSASEHFDEQDNLRVGCIGRPYTYVDIAARAADGAIVPHGEIGELTIRGEHVMSGYWNKPAETAKVLRDGWLWSGDLCSISEDGIITLTGRSKDMLICGGFNVYPQEIEAVLTSFASVAEAAVIGLPDSSWGEIAVALISEAPGATLDLDQIKRDCRRILGFKAPKTLLVAKRFPMSPNGKIDKKVLRDRLEFNRESYDAGIS